MLCAKAGSRLAEGRSMALILLALLQGCVVRPAETSPGRSEGIQVQIDNREFTAWQVYLMREGLRIHLGTVDGHTTRTFPVQSPLLPADGRLGLIAVTRAGTEWLQSPVVMAMPGQRVSWRIEHASFGRSVTVR